MYTVTSKALPRRAGMHARAAALLALLLALLFAARAAGAQGAYPAGTPQPEAYAPASTQGFFDPVYADDSLLYYFYRPTCPYCAQRADMLLGGLPETVLLPDGTRSRVVLIALNKSDAAEGDVIAQYYQAQAVDAQHRLVPSLLIGARYLCGSEALRDGFLQALLAGEGRDTPLLNGQERAGVRGETGAVQSAREETGALQSAPEETYAVRGETFHALLNALYAEPEQYAGRRVQIAGLFYQGPNEELDAERFACVYEWQSGCCDDLVRNGLEVIWDDPVSPYPENGARVLATGRLERYAQAGYALIRLRLESLTVTEPPPNSPVQFP